MIPWRQLGSARIPDNGGELRLSQRGEEFSIHLAGVRGELMNSRVHSSELALAELGCAHIAAVANASVLVGGMGMGFTLAAVLQSISSSSRVTVSELVPEIMEWNQGALGACAGRPLEDARVSVCLGDVAELFKSGKAVYDVVLLDIDNGPEAFTQRNNSSLYGRESLQAIRQTLRADGMLAIWSAWHDPDFVQQLKKARFDVVTKSVRAHKGKGSRHTIYLARKIKGD